MIGSIFQRNSGLRTCSDIRPDSRICGFAGATIPINGVFVRKKDNIVQQRPTKGAASDGQRCLDNRAIGTPRAVAWLSRPRIKGIVQTWTAHDESQILLSGTVCHGMEHLASGGTNFWMCVCILSQELNMQRIWSVGC
jgi:hypothetical protein